MHFCDKDPHTIIYHIYVHPRYVRIKGEIQTFQYLKNKILRVIIKITSSFITVFLCLHYYRHIIVIVE